MTCIFNAVSTYLRHQSDEPADVMDHTHSEITSRTKLRYVPGGVSYSFCHLLCNFECSSRPQPEIVSVDHPETSVISSAPTGMTHASSTSLHSQHQSQIQHQPSAFSLQHILMEGKLFPPQPPTVATSLGLPANFWEEGCEKMSDELCKQLQVDLRW